MSAMETTHARLLADEIRRRRTFAIISHPDAGKTTLTEKLLLYGGAIDLAGSVRMRKSRRHATSDWMALEQERGISITSTVLQFEYDGYRLNLLDTPGHQDFSEDTYRTLMAVDSAVMVLDAAKGIEAQTRKLFEVCRMRRIPILTFINKLDRYGREPLALLDEIEEVLGIAPVSMNWPIGEGNAFRGVYDLQRQAVLQFQRAEHGQYRAELRSGNLQDPDLRAQLGSHLHDQLVEDVELLQAAGASFDLERFRMGEQTPVYFGSALNNFGVEPFLQALLELAPEPQPRWSDQGPLPPSAQTFTGFVFKTQANMDPRHRDRVAFLRVCSGRFEKDMEVYHQRLGRKVRMTRPYRLFGHEREAVDEAYPGDVIGLYNPGLFAIGDTVSQGGPLALEPLPRFQPEHFARLRNVDISKYKQFHKGLQQLEEEGAIQVLFSAQDSARREPILAAVGELQFDVVKARLEMEYKVGAEVERLPYHLARWVDAEPKQVAAMTLPSIGTMKVQDAAGQTVLLFESQWTLQYCQEKNPDLSFITWH